MLPRLSHPVIPEFPSFFNAEDYYIVCIHHFVFSFIHQWTSVSFSPCGYYEKHYNEHGYADSCPTPPQMTTSQRKESGLDVSLGTRPNPHEPVSLHVTWQ